MGEVARVGIGNGGEGEVDGEADGDSTEFHS